MLHTQAYEATRSADRHKHARKTMNTRPSIAFAVAVAPAEAAGTTAKTSAPARPVDTGPLAIDMI